MLSFLNQFKHGQEMRESKDPIVYQFINGLAEGPLTDRRRAGGYETDLLTETIL